MSASRPNSDARRRVLVVAPAFPPHPSPATHRTRFLARYAPAHGWAVEVLSVDPAYYEETPDAELMRLVPEGLRITRAPAFRPRWTRRLGIGDLGIRSYFPLRRVLRRMCEREPPDVIFIPGAPWHTFLLGADMRAEFGIPYVLDYTDPWVFALTTEQNRPWRKAYWFQRMARALEPRAVRGAAHILAVSEGTNEGIRARHPEIPPERFSAVPFGFEASDFEALRAHPRPNPYWDRTDGLAHFVYVGAMLPHGYETLRALFAAVRRLAARTPAVAERIRMHFFGTTYEPGATRGLVLPHAAEFGLERVVTEHPARIPYIEALNVLASADAVLALGSSEVHYTASKIFPCLLARRPLLAAYHERSSVCDIVRQAGTGELVTYGDEERAEARVEELAGALERVVARIGESVPPLDATAFADYSAQRATERICEIFDRVVVGSAS